MRVFVATIVEMTLERVRPTVVAVTVATAVAARAPGNVYFHMPLAVEVARKCLVAVRARVAVYGSIWLPRALSSRRR